MIALLESPADIAAPRRRNFFGAVMVLALGVVLCGPALAQHFGAGHGGMMSEAPVNPADLKTSWPANKAGYDALTLGGQGYDNWAALQGRKLPATTHPSYPAAGRKKGGSTWRCKECHGWDYKGVKGGYAKGSHFSGIGGIRGAQGRSPGSIARTLRGELHGYTAAMIPNELLDNIARFVSRGQVDTAKYIDYATLRARGRAGRGRRIYQHGCASCHGGTGRSMNFNTVAAPEYVGTVARKSPWEALHKIRFGHPGTVMPSNKAMPDRQISDLLAYLQTLPAK